MKTAASVPKKPSEFPGLTKKRWTQYCYMASQYPDSKKYIADMEKIFPGLKDAYLRAV